MEEWGRTDLHAASTRRSAPLGCISGERAWWECVVPREQAWYRGRMAHQIRRRHAHRAHVGAASELDCRSHRDNAYRASTT